ncbi:MAG: PAS domain S-box protein [Chloroflexi bacterium]|nr:MAG: PAS domain S-box protein [Chloroflexota bacterium]
MTNLMTDRTSILLVSAKPDVILPALEDFGVYCAESIDVALQTLQTEQPMFVLLDSRLEDATTICAAIRQQIDTELTLILGLCDEPAVERLIAAGADDCIIMPASDALIYNRIKTLARLKRQITQQAERKYQHLFDSAKDAIFIIDQRTNQILDANQQAEAWLGYTRAELLNMTHNELEVSLEGYPSITEIIDPIQPEEYQIFEQGYRTKDGRVIPAEISSQFLQYDGVPTILCFARDITRRKLIETQEKAQRQLADALRETAAILNSTLNMDEVIQHILEQAAQVFDAEAATVMMLTPSDQVQIVGFWGYTEQDQQQLSNIFPVRLSDFYNLHWITQHKRPYLISDTQQDPNWAIIDGTKWIRANVAAPLFVDKQIIGFISLEHSQPKQFNETDAQNLMAFAHQAGIAIQNARYHEVLQQANEALAQKIAEATAELTQANQQLKEQIIEREQAQAQLDEERNLLRTLIDTLPDHIYVKDTLSRFITVNHATIQHMKAQSLEDVIGKTDFDFFPLEKASEYYQEELTIFETGQSLIDKENIIIDPQTKEERFYLSSKIPFRNRHGQIIGIVGVNRDVTALRLADRALEQERNLLRSVIDNIPDEVYYKDMDGRLVLANKPYLERLIKQAPHINPIGATNYDYFDEEIANAKQVAAMHLIQNIRQPITVEIQASTPTQEREWLLATQVPLYNSDGEPLGLIGITRNVTSLKQAEDRLAHVVSGAHCLLWSAIVYDVDNLTLNLNISSEAAARNFLPLMMSPGQSYADALQASILPDDWAQLIRESYHAIQNNRQTYAVEVRCRRADGSLRWLRKEIQVQPSTNNTYSLVAVCTDITERKQAEFTLRRANELLEQRVEVRTAELKKSNEELREQIRERLRAEQAEREQRLLAEALSAAAASLSESLELETVLDRILSYAERVVPPHDAAAIMLVENDIFLRTIRYREWQHGISINMASNARYYLDSLPLHSQIYNTRQGVAISDVTTLDKWVALEPNEWLRAYLCVPIQAEGRVIGFISMGSRFEGQFTQEDTHRLQAFSNQAGIAIRNAQLFDATRRHADELNQRVKEATIELETERARLQAILESMIEGVIYFDIDGHARYINPAFELLTGHSADEWMTDSTLWHSLFHQNPDLGYTIIQEVYKQQIWRGESQVQRGDGVIDVAIIATATRNADSDIVGVVVVMRDISAEKRLEAQKARFISTASHELRTPITNMKTRLYLLKRKPETIDVQLPVLESVTDRMRKLVDDLLDVSRFEQGVIKLEPEPIILQNIVARVVEIQQPEAHKKSQQLEINMPTTPLHLYADPERMNQVITNLITNAINYTPEGGKISVLVTQQQGQIILSICDTGIGIPEHLLPEVFKPFFRVQNDGTGAGLGLSITKEIVELHHGEITVESKENEGTCFTIRLPLTNETDIHSTHMNNTS